MSFNKSLFLFLMIMAAGIGSYFSVRDGRYPVAIVNFDFIAAKTMEKDSAAAYSYLRNTILVSGNDPAVVDLPESQLEIRRATLDKLITDSLIYNELKLRFGNEFQAIAERNIGQYIGDNENIENGAKTLYGLDLLEFKKRVLMPQAYREILEGRMYLNNEDFSEWLESARANASVYILTPDLQWEDGEVSLRN